MIKVPDDHILIIVGASGDLTRRKLLPALYKLHCNKLLPSNFIILGAGRTKYDQPSFQQEISGELTKYIKEDLLKEGDKNDFIKKLHYVSFDTYSTSQYYLLKDHLTELCELSGIPANFIFYLATPPSMYEIISEGLFVNDLMSEKNNTHKKIIIEKPFGTDLSSAKKLNARLLSFFTEDQIYRIDHYLGKETVQNLMVTRFSNGIFEPLWNRNYIHHIEISAVEAIGIENRGGYYDQSGALRDMVQNHLLQLAGLVAMEPPAVNSSSAIRNETLKVFQAIKPLNKKDIPTHAIRGQYLASKVGGTVMKAYRDEEGVLPESRTETFIALKFYIENWRWGGVPFYIRTGKRLPTTVTEIVIHFHATPHKLFCFNEQVPNHDNQLVIRIQPDEGILLKFGMKVPGAGFRVQDVNMDFHYSSLADQDLPDAYQRLLLDSMNGDTTLYARGDAVEQAWRFIDPILNFWKNEPNDVLHGYPAGTWGPEIAGTFIEGENLSWRYPCKNLTNDGIYCEL